MTPASPRRALAELARVLPAKALTVDPETIAAHAFDRARFCPAGTAAALVRATSTADVVAVMQVASRHRIPVVPQGARSGISGGANAELLVAEQLQAIAERADPNEQHLLRRYALAGAQRASVTVRPWCCRARRSTASC